MKNPEELRFAKTHEWVAADGTVGISDHAQKEITDVVFVDLPKVGKIISAGDAVCVVESVKAAFDIYAPVGGTIKAVNTAVGKNPALVNQEPYGSGWLYQIEPKTGDNPALMSHDQYTTFLDSDNSH